MSANRQKKPSRFQSFLCCFACRKPRDNKNAAFPPSSAAGSTSPPPPLTNGSSTAVAMTHTSSAGQQEQPAVVSTPSPPPPPPSTASSSFSYSATPAPAPPAPVAQPDNSAAQQQQQNGLNGAQADQDLTKNLAYQVPTSGSPQLVYNSKQLAALQRREVHPQQTFLLPPLAPSEMNKKTLVLDLDETLVHSSFKPISNADFVITMELNNVVHRVYVRKRPGVDHFLKVVAEKWHVVVFTAALPKYADPLLDILDNGKIIKGRLFREHCVQYYGNFVKDLTHLGRSLADAVIIDNSPFSYMFQYENAIPITSWFNDKNDRELYELLPFLDELAVCKDVVDILNRKKLQICKGNSANVISLSSLRAGLTPVAPI